MVVVQMLLPKLLALIIALTLSDWMQSSGNTVISLWPHHLPLAVQVVLMILLADFFRYWLHRWSHQNPLLWRLHAVHHSPELLYWLNVGRFHPLEKALQFVFDTLPFILIGVSNEVIALYFVFYAVNGFFQHSNIRLRYGWLNYLISGAELHRWHHSRNVKESNKNFGNNLIVWDILFGTWFLPKDRALSQLGLENRSYPSGFTEQLITPFVPGINDHDLPPQSLGILLKRVFVWARMQWIKIFDWWPLVWSAQNPKRTQSRLLTRLVKENRNTEFGKEHQFVNISNYNQYIRYVPQQDYESLRPYVEKQESQNRPVLTSNRPVMYALTSGTTGQPKYLPIGHDTLEQYIQEQRLFSYLLYRECPSAYWGKIFGVVSPAVEGYRPSGIPFGSVSGYLHASMPKFIQRQYVVPTEVYNLEDYELKYRLMLCFALAEPNITYFAGANPSSFLRLLEVLEESRESISMCLAQGSLDPLGTLPEGLQKIVQARFKPNPNSVQLLRKAPKESASSFKYYWPNLKVITVWTGGSCGIALSALKNKLPPDTKVVELGYLASEFRGSLTVDAVSGVGLPVLNHSFYEFIEKTEYENGQLRYLELHEISEGNEYYILVTTKSGLYRYFMNDIVRVIGRIGRTPTIRFIQKGRGVTSITGEKVYENQLLVAVDEVARRYQFAPLFLMVLADEDRHNYQVYLEPDHWPDLDSTRLSGLVEDSLMSTNIEYETKRNSGRLDKLVAHWLKPGTAENYKRFCIKKGQREGQFKTIALQYRRQMNFAIDEYVRSTFNSL